MNQSSDAAEQVVRLALNGLEVTAKITGEGAKNIAAMLYAISKDHTKSTGKTKLSNMLTLNKELKVFSVKKDEFDKFKDEAKKYGVLYCALGDKNSSDGIVDILVKAEDAGKINRIVERFKLSRYNEVEIINEIEKSKINTQEKDKGIKQKTIEEKFKEESKIKHLQKDGNSLNPNLAKTEKSPLSKPSLKNKNFSETEGTKLESKSSVRKKLEEYRKEIDSNLERNSEKTNSNQIIHKPNNLKTKRKKKNERS